MLNAPQYVQKFQVPLLHVLEFDFSSIEFIFYDPTTLALVKKKIQWKLILQRIYD